MGRIVNLETTSFEDCILREDIWRQVSLRSLADCNYGNTPLYFGTPSTDGKLIHLAKVGYGAMGLTVYADTVPLAAKETLGVT